MKKKIIINLCIAALYFFTLNCTREIVRDYGIFGLSRIKFVAGQDGCTPIQVDENLMLWTFGDTILGSWKNGVTTETTFEKSGSLHEILDNTAAFTEIPGDKNFHNLEFQFVARKGKPVQIIGDENNKNGKFRYWVVDGIKTGNTVYLYYMIMYRDNSSSVFPFTYEGIGIAKWTMDREWKVGDSVVFKIIGKLFFHDDPSFGDCVIKKDGFLYLIGHKKNQNGNSAYFARVIEADLHDRNKYMYLTNKGVWSDTSQNAHGFYHDLAGEPSLSYNEYLKMFITIYCSIDGTIKMARFGSFKDLPGVTSRVIYTPPKLPEIKTRKFYFYYSGKEIFYTKEAIYAVYMNPAIYQPIIIKVPYNAIGEIIN